MGLFWRIQASSSRIPPVMTSTPMRTNTAPRPRRNQPWGSAAQRAPATARWPEQRDHQQRSGQADDVGDEQQQSVAEIGRQHGHDDVAVQRAAGGEDRPKSSSGQDLAAHPLATAGRVQASGGAGLQLQRHRDALPQPREQRDQAQADQQPARDPLPDLRRDPDERGRGLQRQREHQDGHAERSGDDQRAPPSGRANPGRCCRPAASWAAARARRRRAGRAGDRTADDHRQQRQHARRQRGQDAGDERSEQCEHGCLRRPGRRPGRPCWSRSTWSPRCRPGPPGRRCAGRSRRTAGAAAVLSSKSTLTTVRPAGKASWLKLASATGTSGTSRR